MTYRTFEEVSDDIRRATGRLLVARDLEEQQLLVKVLTRLLAEANRVNGASRHFDGMARADGDLCLAIGRGVASGIQRARARAQP